MKFLFEADHTVPETLYLSRDPTVQAIALALRQQQEFRACTAEELQYLDSTRHIFEDPA